MHDALFLNIFQEKLKKWINTNELQLTRPLCLKTSSIAAPILAGDSTTVTPASLSVLILSCAVPFPPDTIAAQPEASTKINCTTFYE